MHLPSITPILRQPRASNAPSRHKLAEDLAWAHLYRAARRPAAAAEVVRYFDDNPESRERHEALYLIACETLHAKALADEQSQRTAATLRMIFVVVPVRTWRLVKSVVLSVPATPEGADEAPTARPRPRGVRARSRVGALRGNPEVAREVDAVTTSRSSNAA